MKLILLSIFCLLIGVEANAQQPLNQGLVLCRMAAFAPEEDSVIKTKSQTVPNGDIFMMIDGQLIIGFEGETEIRVERYSPDTGLTHSEYWCKGDNWYTTKLSHNESVQVYVFDGTLENDGKRWKLIYTEKYTE